jgi:hypothetical protein
MNGEPDKSASRDGVVAGLGGGVWGIGHISGAGGNLAAASFPWYDIVLDMSMIAIYSV